MIELTEHPTIYKPSESEILDYEKEFGQEATVSLLMEREQLIRLEKDDPYITGRFYRIGMMQRN